MSELDYKADLRIDQSALDIEFLEQADLYMKYSEQLSLARSVSDRAKQNLDVVEAEIAQKIRENPTEYTVGKVSKKPTEAAIKEIIITSPPYTTAHEKYLKARYTVDILSGAVRAMDHRKVALENLVRLLATQYFASPSEPRDLGLEVEKRAKRKRTNEKVRNMSQRGRSMREEEKD